MGDDNAIAVYLLAYTGVRIGELLSLRCGDVDLDRMTISITKTQSVDVGNRTIIHVMQLVLSSNPSHSASRNSISGYT